MPAKKIRELVVKTGSYRDRDGNEKPRWKNVGSLMESEDGGKFILLDTTFNPAGVPNPDNRDNVLISIFEMKDNDGGQRSGGGATPRNNEGPRQAAQTRQSDVADDDIPFITQHANW